MHIGVEIRSKNMGRSDLFDLTGKVAIVTGAGRGIGRAASIGLARFGADIAAVGRKLDSVQETSKEVCSLGRESIALSADVSDEGSVRTMVRQVREHFGRIDILINNAGLTNRKPALETTVREWEELFRVNLLGVFLCAKAVGQVMIEQGRGKIINMTSTVGVRGDRNRSIYAATKAGVIQLTKVLANEWGQYNIQVNAIGPCYIETPMTEGILADPEAKRQAASTIPLGRVGKPEDLIGAFVFLSSIASDFVTGHTLFVDGGYLVD